MMCPHCHNENPIDALTCEFCMHELPMTEERKKQIKSYNKLNKKSKLKGSIAKLIGLIAGLFAIILVIVLAWFFATRG